MNDVENKPENATLDDCVQYGREVRDQQKAFVAEQQYDFAPQFEKMTAELYLIGAMWRFSEDQGVPGDARENAFAAYGKMMVVDGVHAKAAGKQIDFLKKMSKLEDGSNALAVAVGYRSKLEDQGLVEVYDQHVDDVQVSGDFWRLYERIKKTMMYGGMLITVAVIWFFTLFMPSFSTLSILTAGLVSAALFVIPVFIIGVLLYRSKIKKAKKSLDTSS